MPGKQHQEAKFLDYSKDSGTYRRTRVAKTSYQGHGFESQKFPELRETRVAQSLQIFSTLAQGLHAKMQGGPSICILMLHQQVLLKEDVLLHDKIPYIIFCVSQLPLDFPWVTALCFWELLTGPEAELS